MTKLRAPILYTASLVALALPATASADPPSPSTGYHPWATQQSRILTIDMSPEARAARGDALISKPQPVRDWSILDRVESADSELDLPLDPPQDVDPQLVGRLPDGWVQRGSVVLPEPIANGDLQVDPDVALAVEDKPGNEYPRKHTLYLNFVGEDLASGTDNSAENRSMLAKNASYPAYEGGNNKAISIAQAVAEDVAAYGIRVVYLPEDRPSKTVPYTMEMVGGQWQDTNIDSPAGGVAPGADCGALGQRHVVYTFAGGGTGVNTAANTASQEAGHGWGLDHTFNCGSVMSYCGIANGIFSDTCDDLCEAQCQGANSAGCRLTHEKYCGEGTDQQNEDAELSFIFGGNEPDVEPPFVNIVEPEDGIHLDAPADVDIRAEVGDNYGGYGWKFVVSQNGEVVVDQVDYDREVDSEFRAVLKLTGLDDGEWDFTVEVEDQFGMITSQTVTVVVGTGIPAGEGDDGSGDGGSGDDGGSGGQSGDDGSGGTAVESMSDTGMETPEDPGCGCSTDGSRNAGWASVLGLALFGLVRRRR